MLRRLVWLLAGGLAAPSLLAAPKAHTEARLLLGADSARAGETVWAGVRLKMEAGWHTYWVNPGDSGEATRIRWELPAGITAGEIQWPVPQRYEVAGLTTYVFHDEVVLLVPLQIAADRAPGPVEIKATVSWLECEQLCLPGSARVSATFRVGAASKPSASASVVESWRRRLPRAETPPGLAARWDGPGEGETRVLVIEWQGGGGEPDFLPWIGTDYEVAGATERLPVSDGRVRLRKEVRRKDGAVWPAQVAGVLVEHGKPEPTAYVVRLSLTAGGAAAPPAAHGQVAVAAVEVAGGTAGNRSLAWMLGFAFVGGLLLNIMPCVLPVIALKVLSFVSQARESPARVRRLGTVYGLGVMLSFLALGVFAVVVQQAGGSASWGMALQNPVFRVALTVVVTLVALNLFGLFEVTLGSKVLGAADQLAGREGAAGAFFNGMLAAVLATPCTAPFLTVALAFAFTQPPPVILLFFLVAGLGLASPFVLLCWKPAWRRWMPKPGAWMQAFKVAMGFPMLATAVWVFWFTAPRYGKNGVLWLGLFLVLVAAAVWTWGEFVQRGRRRRGLAGGVALAMLAFGYVFLLERQLQWRAPVPAAASTVSLRDGADGIDWQPWSPEAVAQARAEGRPVLVDFTADNCLNCQANKVTSLEIASTRAKLKDIGAVAFLADFTDQDPRIADELRRHERAGVPLVLVYPADSRKPPIVLPPILTPSIVLDALAKAGRRAVSMVGTPAV